MTTPPHLVDFQQTDVLRDHVFPLATSRPNPDGTEDVTVRGTGFLIGDNLGMTAAHVAIEMMRDFAKGTPIAMFVDSRTEWFSVQWVNHELHPREDAALFWLDDRYALGAFLRPSLDWVGSVTPYMLWGYPEDTYWELTEGGGRPLVRPDMIYSEGHVRRRLSNVPLPGIRGQNFLELSQVAGAGCSGGPVIQRLPGVNRVSGIYVGERINDRATSVGYAVRIGALADWRLTNGEAFSDLCHPNPVQRPPSQTSW